MKIPVIINNRDLLTWPKEMVEKIKTYDNVGDIIVLDNGSTYEPLLEWYNTKPCEIIYGENRGHTAPWLSGLVEKLNTKYYVVSDPDLGINDTLTYLVEKMETNSLPKLGLGLNYDLCPSESPYYQHLMNYEKPRYINSRLVDNVYLDVETDTTFALYKNQHYFIGGGIIGNEYIAKHFPWYLTDEDRKNNEEFMYYLKNASTSSSYKTYLKL